MKIPCSALVHSSWHGNLYVFEYSMLHDWYLLITLSMFEGRLKIEQAGVCKIL